MRLLRGLNNKKRKKLGLRRENTNRLFFYLLAAAVNVFSPVLAYEKNAAQTAESSAGKEVSTSPSKIDKSVCTHRDKKKSKKKPAAPSPLSDKK
jgi:hypothetical protein